MQDEVDPTDGMTEQEYKTVKKVIEEGNLNLSIELWEEEPRIRLHTSMDGYGEAIARVSLQPLISHAIFALVDANQGEKTRSQLFILAGRLRELAQIAEDRAKRLNTDIKNWTSPPMLEPYDEFQGQSLTEGQKHDEDE